MTDYTDLIARLRDDYQKTVGLCAEAADALEAQARQIALQERRIVDLRKEADMMHSEYKTAAARIAALNEEVERYRQRWLSAESVIDVRHDRIAELIAALKPFADKADKAECPFEPPYPVDYPLWRAARAALGEKE